MEDFGYKKDEKHSKFFDFSKKSFLLGATLFSISCFVYVTINAYYFVYQDAASNIEVIKAEEGPMKVFEKKAEEGEASMQIDRTIYEDIFGNKSQQKKVTNPTIRKAPTPAIPPANIKNDRRLIKEPSDLQETEEKEQKIITFSNVKEPTSKDFLTKISGKERVIEPKAKKDNSQKRLIRVQIAAMTSEEAAQESWRQVSRISAELFAGLKPFIVEADLGKRGIFYRLQIGNFFNQIEAEEFCNKYVSQANKSRGDCIIVE
jgi:hypothetical protein